LSNQVVNNISETPLSNQINVDIVKVIPNKKSSGSRLFGLDVARLIAMLMMVQGHTVYCLLNPGILESGLWYWNLWTFVRGFTAPVFLMVSGAVHIFANKRDENGALPRKTLKKRIKVCFMLFVIGYLLQFPANNLYDLPFLNTETLYSFFKISVLQMFAATLILLNIIFVLTKNNKTLAIITCIIGNIMIIGSHFTLQINWFNIMPIPFASFMSMQHGTLFPLFPFAGYLLIGSSMGYLIQKVDKDKRDKFIIKNFFLIGIPYIILGVVFNHYYEYGMLKFLGKPTISMGISLYRVGATMLFISVSTLFCKVLKRYEDIISMFSKRSLFIYVIHLLIIYGSPITPGLRHIFFNVEPALAFYCAIFVIFFSLLIVYIYDKSSKIEAASYLYKYIIVALLIYMLFI
jgi:uncharacterized membrane protein